MLTAATWWTSDLTSDPQRQGAGRENDASDGGQPVSWTCWWIALKDALTCSALALAHVLEVSGPTAISEVGLCRNAVEFRFNV